MIGRLRRLICTQVGSAANRLPPI